MSQTSLRKATFDNLQLNEGVLLKDVDYSSVTDSAALKTAIANILSGGNNPIGGLIGATRGGGSFTITRDIRTPDIDGMRYKFVKGDFVDSVDAYISATLVEVTKENVCAILGVDVPTASGKKTTIKLPTALTDDSYLTNICWVGELNDGRRVLICLSNAINTADFSLTFSDKSEGTLAVEFHACQDDVDDYEYAPFEIVYFDNPST
jgi:hypothetical protein